VYQVEFFVGVDIVFGVLKKTLGENPDSLVDVVL